MSDPVPVSSPIPDILEVDLDRQSEVCAFTGKGVEVPCPHPNPEDQNHNHCLGNIPNG